MEVYKILKIWGTDDALARCGLMHSEQQHTSAAAAVECYSSVLLQCQQIMVVATGSHSSERRHSNNTGPTKQLLRCTGAAPLRTRDAAPGILLSECRIA
jgi:hypothetical protein